MAKPTEEQLEDILLSCRYGEQEEVKAFTEEFGWEAIGEARDERGNSCLHMCCGNGHVDILNFLLPHLPQAVLTATNEAGSPPLHWAIQNNHVSCVKALVELPEEKGGGIALLKQKNRSDRDAFSESLFAGEGKEEVAGWIEGYLWRIEGGDDDDGTGGGDAQKGVNGDGAVELKVEYGDAVTRGEVEAVDELVERTGDVEIKETT